MMLYEVEEVGFYDKVPGSNGLSDVYFLDEFYVLFDVFLIVTEL